jgi:hypothetical protein
VADDHEAKTGEILLYKGRFPKSGKTINLYDKDACCRRRKME